MAVAALILGIISFLISFIPLLGYVSLIPAIIGLILGIVFLAKKKIEKEKTKQEKGMSIAGIVLSSLALLVLLWWTLMIGMVIDSGLFEKARDAIQNEIENNYPNHHYDENFLQDDYYEYY